MVLLRLLGLVLDVLLLPLRALRRARAVPEGAFVVLTVDGPVADVVVKPRLWEMRAKRATSIHSLTELVAEITRDDRVRGLLVTIKELGGGLATATSIRAQLARARGAGKEVVVHLPMGGGTKEALVASAASKIYLGPATVLAPLGFVSTTRYWKGTLERAGVEPEVFACGDHKAAGETLVRSSMSAPQRQQLERILETFHEALIDAIAEGRGVSRERAAALVDGAPYFGEAAVEAGIADGIAYEDEVPGLLGLGKTSGRRPSRASRRRRVDAGAYLALKKRPLVRSLGRRPVVAVVPVHGAISHGAGLFEPLATDERVARMIRVARADRSVRAVVLHVDSPGGSALASDRMHHEIQELAREKPVVACMANVAASGGYYVSAPAHRVVCEPTTITGSIGVVSARLSIEPLLMRLGANTETLRRGARAGLLSAELPLSSDERGALRRELDAVYRGFVGVVARGRKMSEEEVERLAQGRVYSGRDALANGLVDALGGFEEAMREVRKLLPEDVRDRVEPRVVRLPRRPVPLLDPPTEGEAGRRAAWAILSALVPDGERALAMLAATGERVLALWTGSIHGD